MLPELADSIERFQQEMKSVDEVANVLLKGHLLIEEALARILDQYVFYPGYLDEVRLSFFQKMLLARGLCLRQDTLGEWELIAALNSLRNVLAHDLTSSAREKKLTRIKEIYFREAADMEDIDEIRGNADHVVLFFACAHCAGFLAHFEADSKEFRRLVHAMDRTLHPHLPPFPLEGK